MAGRFIKLSFTFSALALTVCVPAYAQQTAPLAPPAAPTGQLQLSAPAPREAPQVNAVVHVLNGLKVLYLLRRNGAKVAPLDDETLLKSDTHTSITAGLLLEDGSIVARLPQAELEAPAAPQLAGFYSPVLAPKPPEPPANLFIVQRDGQQFEARFVGLDGGTGLSLLRVEGLRVAPSAPARDAKEATLMLGQRVRLLAPARAQAAEEVTAEKLFLNMSELVGSLTEISRASSGNITSLTVRADKLSSGIVGGIAINEAGETIGLIESSGANEVRLIPVAALRRAVERIHLKLESKPQPWLGARGEAVAATSLEQLMFVGWKSDEANKLLNQRLGIVLTSVPPQTPAWSANLRVGDVVTRVNTGEVKSAEDFSTLLKFYAKGSAPVRFTILRPDRVAPRVVSVKLRESLNPVLAMEAAESLAARTQSADPLLARGLETLAITPKFASRLQAQGGLLIIFVHPESAAARAGLQPGDVIESLDGKLLSEANPPTGSLPQQVSLSIIRGGKKLEVKLLAEPSGQNRPR